MAQVLSQDEVDALLSAVGDGDLEEDSTSSSESEQDEDIHVQSYDLTNQDRVIRGRMPVLEIIYERFIRSYRVSLTNSLRKLSTISMISTDLLKFGEFVNTLRFLLMCIMRLMN